MVLNIKKTKKLCSSYCNHYVNVQIQNQNQNKNRLHPGSFQKLHFGGKFS